MLTFQEYQEKYCDYIIGPNGEKYYYDMDSPGPITNDLLATVEMLNGEPHYWHNGCLYTKEEWIELQSKLVNSKEYKNWIESCSKQ